MKSHESSLKIMNTHGILMENHEYSWKIMERRIIRNHDKSRILMKNRGESLVIMKTHECS